MLKSKAMSPKFKVNHMTTPLKITRGIKADIYAMKSRSEPIARFIAIFGRRSICSCPMGVKENPETCFHVTQTLKFRAAQRKRSRRVAVK